MVVGLLLCLLYPYWSPTVWVPIASGGVFEERCSERCAGKNLGRLKRVPVRAAVGRYVECGGFLLQDVYFGVLLASESLPVSASWTISFG